MPSRLEKLKELEAHLYVVMQTADCRSVAAVAKQYRETIREIEEIEGETAGIDGIEEIMQERKADGKSRTVRQDRSGV